MQSSPNPKKHRLPLDLTLLEMEQLRIWAASQGLKVQPALRAMLYRQGILKPPAKPGEKP
jgi:hypothetical protein